MYSSVPVLEGRSRRLTWGKQVSDLAIVRSLSYSPRSSDDPESLGGKFSPHSRTIGFNIQTPVVEDDEEYNEGFLKSHVDDGFSTPAHARAIRLPEPGCCDDTLNPFFAEHAEIESSEDDEFSTPRGPARYRHSESEESVLQALSAPLCSGIVDTHRPSENDEGEEFVCSLYTFNSRPLSSDDLAGMGLSSEAVASPPIRAAVDLVDVSCEGEWIILGGKSHLTTALEPGPVQIRTRRRSKSLTDFELSERLCESPSLPKRKSCRGEDWG